jgi:hypothetical protein
MLSEGTRLTLRLNDNLTSKTARSGDRFTAHVVTPVYKGRTLVVPAGSTVIGRVAHVTQAGRFRGRAEMDLRFERLRLPNGAEEPIVTRLANLGHREKKQVEKEGTAKEQDTKKRDAVIDATGSIGAAGCALIGLGTILAMRDKHVKLPRGLELDIVLDRPLRLPVSQ